jgi:hypothetical protein
LLLLSGLPLLVVGCKSEPTVTGIVRLDGDPLEHGSIRFVPVKGTPGSDAGAVIRLGKYSIPKGLTVGKYKVEIQGARKVPGKKTRDLISDELRDDEVPIEFAEFDQIREVGPGPNPLDFDLKEKRARKGR